MQLVIKRAFDTGTKHEKESIKKFLGTTGNGAEEFMEILSILRKQEVPQYGISEIKRLKDNAWKSFESLTMKDPYKSRIIEFIDRLIKIN